MYPDLRQFVAAHVQRSGLLREKHRSSRLSAAAQGYQGRQNQQALCLSARSLLAFQFLRALRIRATPREAVHGISTDRLAFPKTWSADVDIVLLAVSEVFSRPKNRVCQYTRRIVTKASSIGFNGCLQRSAFAESIPSQILYAHHPHESIGFDWGSVYCGHEDDPCGAPDFPEPNFDIMFFVDMPPFDSKGE